MLNQINAKIKLFDHEIISFVSRQNFKTVAHDNKHSYLAPLYRANSVLIDNYIQLVTYFV